jgi:hypothetical protein
MTKRKRAEYIDLWRLTMDVAVSLFRIAAAEGVPGEAYLLGVQATANAISIEGIIRETY